jgi:hypothetical protein
MRKRISIEKRYAAVPKIKIIEASRARARGEIKVHGSKNPSNLSDPTKGG